MRRAAADLLVVTLLLGTMLRAAGCGAKSPAGSPSPSPSPPAGSRVDPDLVGFTGLPDIQIGASLRDLVAAGRVATPAAACGPAIVGHLGASPIFDGDRLVLLWANPPLHTVEGVMVGAPLDQVRRAYPDALDLLPPSGSTTFPGLLVRGEGGYAYLLLHDGVRVQKLIVGLESYARRLVSTGFGTC